MKRSYRLLRGATARVRAVLSALLIAAASAVATAGCHGVLFPYDGPRPASEDLRGEIAIVRSEYIASTRGMSYIMDRTRFVDSGDLHHVDRVVRVSTDEATAAQVRAMGLAVGERILISTRYDGETEAAELTEVPNWPGHRHYEYPIGQHTFTAVQRVP